MLLISRLAGVLATNNRTSAGPDDQCEPEIDSYIFLTYCALPYHP
jgi:hypothetical protein